MPSPGFCRIEGETQGLITQDILTEESVGIGWVAGHEEECIFQDFVQEVYIPKQGHTFAVSGRRVHEPVRITKIIDKCSPMIHEALKNNELLTNVRFRFFRIDATGTQEEYYRVTLENASVSHIRNYMPDYTDPANEHHTFMQEVDFIYERILVEHMVGRTASQDAWHNTE